MGDVEALCDRVFMLNRGKRVLYGKLKDIRKEYGQSVRVEYGGRLVRVSGVAGTKKVNGGAELELEKGFAPKDVIRKLVAKNNISRFEIASPSLEDIFVEVVKK